MGPAIVNDPMVGVSTSAGPFAWSLSTPHPVIGDVVACAVAHSATKTIVARIPVVNDLMFVFMVVRINDCNFCLGFVQ
jgi:hypothetical protein